MCHSAFLGGNGFLCWQPTLIRPVPVIGLGAAGVTFVRTARALCGLVRELLGVTLSYAWAPVKSISMSVVGGGVSTMRPLVPLAGGGTATWLDKQMDAGPDPKLQGQACGQVYLKQASRA